MGWEQMVLDPEISKASDSHVSWGSLFPSTPLRTSDLFNTIFKNFEIDMESDWAYKSTIQDNKVYIEDQLWMVHWDRELFPHKKWQSWNGYSSL